MLNKLIYFKDKAYILYLNIFYIEILKTNYTNL